MAPPPTRTGKNDTGRVRHRHDLRLKDLDPKPTGKELKRKPVKILPPGLREEEDDEDWPPKYKKAPPPPKIRKVPARHPRTGRKQWDSTPPAPRPKVDLRVSPERAVDIYDSGWRNTTEGDPEVYERRMRMFYEQLKKDREFMRKKLIQNGLLADPDKPTTLENAITIVGTCQDMCPVHERVERIVQQMVDKCEKVVHPATGEDVPYEDYMVKRFRRSAAGDDEQLPSDIRPPLVLQKTLNYLLEELVNGPDVLSKVHKFVWDRTRGIRNDFSIQQVTEPDDVRIAMDCFERIARFHILALHQLSLSENVENSDFDAHQELEQLNKTLLSLTYYYDDNRDRVTSPNEAEFRAYTIMIEIEYPRPRLEQRAGAWPKPILEDAQVQMALGLYAICGGIEDGQGPWFAGSSFELAQGNPRSFFSILKSPKVPYLLACVAEISFYHIRGLILESIWEEFKDGEANSLDMGDLLEEDVRAILGFDDVDQATRFCLSHGITMKIMKDKTILNLDEGDFKRDRRRSRPQVFSKKIVEDKRAFRTYLEVTNGLWAPQEGIEEALDDLEASVRESYEPLFVSDDSDDGKMDASPAQGPSRATHQTSFTTAELTSTPNPSRGFTESNALPNTSSFGKPTPAPLPPFQNSQNSTTSRLSVNFKGPEDTHGPNSSKMSLAAGKEQSPFSQPPVSSPNPPKAKMKFSAPPGKWQLPKGVIDKYKTDLASPASSNPKSAAVSPQAPSENTNAQPVPFTSSSFAKKSSPNPFSQVLSKNTDAQSAASAKSNLFKTAFPDPFSQVSSGDINMQPAPPAYPGFSSKSLSPNSFSQVSSESTNAPKQASPHPSPYSNLPQPSSGPVSQVSPDNTTVWPAVSPFYGSFNHVNFFNSVGMASLPTWEMLSSFQRSSIQVRPTNSFPVSLAASPFSGSINGVNFSNPHAAASLPSWTTSLTTQNTPVATSSNPQPASWSVSSALPISSSFNSSVPSSDQLGAASLPASTAPSALQNPPGSSFSYTPTSPSAVSPQGPPSASTPTISSSKSLPQTPFSFSDPPMKPSSTPLKTSLSPSSPSSNSPFSTSRPLLSFSNPTISSSSPLLNAPPLSSSQPENPPSAVQKAPLLFNQPKTSPSALQNASPLSSQTDKPTAAVQDAALPSSKLETPSALQNVPLSSVQPGPPLSIPPVTHNTPKEPKASTPIAEEVPSASLRQRIQSPNTTILTMKTLKTPAVVLTPPTGEEDSKEALKPATYIPVTPPGSISLPSIKMPKDAPSPESSLKYKAYEPFKFFSASPAKTSPLPLESITRSEQQAEIGPRQSDRRSETVDAISKGIVLDKGCLMQQFLEFHMPNIVQDCFKQVEDERSQKEAEEYRVMTLSKKYMKMWRTIAWRKGLMRRAPERRRRFAQSLQEMARDTARHKEDLMASLWSQKSENRDQQEETEVSTASILTRSTSSKKRKSPDIEHHSTPERVSLSKRSRLDQVQNEHLTPSRRMKAGHKRSATEEKPKLSETEELINTLIATRDDYTYLANGSVSSYKIIQKIRTLLPPVKLDDTRSDYFMLKSLGIDPDTPIVPRTSRKRHSSDDIQNTPGKRLKESPVLKSESALPPPSYHPQSRSPSSWTKSSRKLRDQSVTAQLIDFDETENELLAVQRKLNSKMTDVIEWYREQRAKWGSGRISTSSPAPSRSIEYYKEQRAKWGTPGPITATNPHQFTPTRTEEVLRGSRGYSAQSIRVAQDTKSAFRAAIEQRQRDMYATMQPGPEGPSFSDGGIVQSPSPAAAAVTPAGSSAEAAIEL